jgi:hypothetical protein
VFAGILDIRNPKSPRQQALCSYQLHSSQRQATHSTEILRSRTMRAHCVFCAFR